MDDCSEHVDADRAKGPEAIWALIEQEIFLFQGRRGHDDVVGKSTVVLSALSLGHEYRRNVTLDERSFNWDGLKQACKYYSERDCKVFAVVLAASAQKHALPQDLPAEVVFVPDLKDDPVLASSLMVLRIAMECECQFVDNLRYSNLPPWVNDWLRREGPQQRVEFLFGQDGVFVPLYPPKARVTSAGCSQDGQDGHTAGAEKTYEPPQDLPSCRLVPESLGPTGNAFQAVRA